jgi:hypothetical protein
LFWCHANFMLTLQTVCYVCYAVLLGGRGAGGELI